MSIIVFLLFGFIVGLIARAIMPGRQSMSLLMTTLLGVVGSFLGGMIGSLFYGGPLLEFHTAGLIGSIVGALAVLAIMSSVSNRKYAV